MYCDHCALATIAHGLYFWEPSRGVKLHPAGGRPDHARRWLELAMVFSRQRVACGDHRVLLAAVSSLVLEKGRICWACRVSPGRVFCDVSMLIIFNVDLEWLR